MMLASVLDSDATINSFEKIGSLAFIPGEDARLVIQIYQEREDHLRYIVPTGATLEVSLPNKDSTTLDLAMTAFTLDRSIWYVDLTALQTEELSGGNFVFEIDDAGRITKGWVQNGLRIIVTGAC